MDKLAAKRCKVRCARLCLKLETVVSACLSRACLGKTLVASHSYRSEEG
jgi:hypothetical protein